MRRRTFVLAAGALMASTRALGQPRGRLARVGLLFTRSPQGPIRSDPSYGAFLLRMAELGYVEGGTVAYEWRFVDGLYDRLPGLAVGLVHAKVDVIVAGTPPAVQAAMKATSAIPIVMLAVGDPVTLGFVASLGRPGGNVTGVTNAIDDAATKYLELLRSALPKLSRVVSLANPDNPNFRVIFDQIESSAKKMGIETRMAEARTPEEITRAFAAMRTFRPGAFIVQADGFLANRAAQIAELAVRDKVATIAWTRGLVESGVLMSYGQNVPDDSRNAANYVDRILKGAKPADLPVERPLNPKLTINGRTAATLGIRLPQDLLLRADQVIE
jgi:putative ABC transport system substrate-binding protein